MNNMEISNNENLDIDLFSDSSAQDKSKTLFTNILGRNRRLSKLVESTLKDLEIEAEKTNPEEDKMKEILNEKIYITEKSIKIRKKLKKDENQSPLKKKSKNPQKLKPISENYVDLPKISPASKELTKRALTKLIYIILLTDTVISLLASDTFKEISNGLEEDARFFGFISQTKILNISDVASYLENKYEDIGVKIVQIEQIDSETGKELFGFYNFTRIDLIESFRKGEIYVSKWRGGLNVSEENLIEFNRNVTNKNLTFKERDCIIRIKVFKEK